MYVHVRCQAYVKAGIDLDVLNLSAKKTDVVDGIHVLTLNDYLNQPFDLYDVLIVHAANIRQHYRFVRTYGSRFARYIFFFHGHEVLKISKVYPRDYPYMRKNWAKILAQDVYDTYKLRTWRNFFIRNAGKTDFVFVSKWMRDEFIKWTNVPLELLQGRSRIIYNSVHRVFEENRWDPDIPKEYDFITIRGNWDGAKYGVDIVNNLAKNNPELRFLLVGKGQFFDHYQKAENLVLLEQHLQPQDMLEYLNKSRCALMPTRTDAQGLMMCEMASYGMPLIASDIPVCMEVFEGFDNVIHIENEHLTIDLAPMIQKLEGQIPFNICKRFYESHTTAKEIDLLRRKVRR